LCSTSQVDRRRIFELARVWDAVSIMSPRSAISYRDIGTSTAWLPACATPSRGLEIQLIGPV
jgi:hypothetical protein